MGIDWDEVGETIWKVEKFIIKAAAATAVTVGVVATGGAAAPLVGGLVIAEGICIKKATEGCDNEVVKEVGEIVGDSLIDGGAGGVIGGSGKAIRRK